jgi:hypothetical protein
MTSFLWTDPGRKWQVVSNLISTSVALLSGLKVGDVWLLLARLWTGQLPKPLDHFAFISSPKGLTGLSEHILPLSRTAICGKKHPAQIYSVILLVALGDRLCHHTAFPQLWAALFHCSPCTLWFSLYISLMMGLWLLGERCEGHCPRSLLLALCLMEKVNFLTRG